VSFVSMTQAFNPLTSLEARLKCPMCGSQRVSVIFDVPSEPAAMRTAGMPSR
jgi:hypothetical protein